MHIKDYSLVPHDYKEKDPRTLPFLYPESLNIVAYAKKVQKFSFYQTLEVAEDIVNRQGFILIPFSCVHWQRAKAYGVDRKIKIGRNSFFMMKPDELTKNEKRKLEEYIQELRGNH